MLFPWHGRAGSHDPLLQALDRSLAMIDLDPQGNILAANEIFCATFGYEPEELVGRQDRTLCPGEFAASPAYAALWEKLRRGEFHAGEYRQLRKDGTPIWFDARFYPLRDRSGNVFKIVKLGTDVTAAKAAKSIADGKVAADSGIAVIEFTPTGEILTANDVFLRVTGYDLPSIQGRHHRIFVDPELAASPGYAAMWATLGRGQAVAGDFHRVSKSGAPITLQGSYTPVFDGGGTLTKVVKMAQDITDKHHAVQVIGQALAQLAAQNVGHRVTQPLDPTFEPLRLDFNKAAEHLDRVLAGITGNAQAIRAGAREIAQAADDLSRRTEHQAATVEQTAASLDSITALVSRTATGARDAGEGVDRVRQEAKKSGVTVANAVAAMGEIERSAEQIGQIIGVIDEIAFQTNLLALNAGVEAARAGEAGRGFAVVASEVRALAQRSAEAAKEIKALISASTRQVGAGVSLVAETGQEIGRIVEQVSKVSDVVLEISGAAQTQAASLAELNAAANQTDKVVQQNAAMVEQSTAACHALAHETEELAGLIGQFRISHPVAARTPQPAARGSRPRPRLVPLPG